MSGRMEGKVAFITGAARGQGRSHAVRLAEEGADIIAVDLCAQVESVTYPTGTAEELAETQRLVEALDRRIITRTADVRRPDQLQAALADGVATLGRLDTVVVSHGIASYAPAHEITDQAWQEMIDINLTGVWQTIKAAVPHLVPQRSGSVVVVNSASGLIAPANLGHYVAAKHGAIGIARTFANELAQHMIRVNSVCPTQVDTPMIMHDETYRMFRPDLDNPTREDIVDVSVAMNAIPVPWVDARDVSNAVLFLASDEARYITGVALPVDAGIIQKV